MADLTLHHSPSHLDSSKAADKQNVIGKPSFPAAPKDPGEHHAAQQALKPEQKDAILAATSRMLIEAIRAEPVGGSEITRGGTKEYVAYVKANLGKFSEYYSDERAQFNSSGKPRGEVGSSQVEVARANKTASTFGGGYNISTWNNVLDASARLERDPAILNIVNSAGK